MTDPSAHPLSGGPPGTARQVWRTLLGVHYLRNVLIASMAVALVLPLCNILFIYPAFTDQLIANTEDESVRLAHHLARTLFPEDDISLRSLELHAGKTNTVVDEVVEDFGIPKIKFFAPDGRVVFSTQLDEVGTMQMSDEFRSIVDERAVYSNFVHSKSMTLEQQAFTADVVETYVPVVRGDRLVGVFEIYYDVTRRNQAMSRLLTISSLIMAGLALSLLGAVALVLAQAAGNVRRRMQAETLLQKANTALEDTNERLREVDERKTEFLATVSHDLRTPLASITGFAQLADRHFAKGFEHLAETEDQLKRAGKIRSNLGLVSSEVMRLVRLVNDLLDLEKIESGHMDWRDQPVDVAMAVRTAMAAMQSQFEQLPEVEARVQVPEQGKDAQPSVFMDPDRLAQVLTNLIGNAAKFTRQGHVTASVLQEDGHVRISVEDTGAGIPAESLKTIFDRFAQADNLAKDHPKGTGLGLAIAHDIVLHYNGRIWAESEVGKGSVFHVVLPAHAA